MLPAQAPAPTITTPAKELLQRLHPGISDDQVAQLIGKVHGLPRIPCKKVQEPKAQVQRLPLPTLQYTKPCVFLGDPVRQAPCGCGKKVRECAIHDTCTTEVPVKDLKCCHTCKDYQSIDDPGSRRHLLYFVFPSMTGNWRWNLDQIKARLPLFNGRRSIAIATNSAKHVLDAPRTVMDYFGRHEADWLVVPQKRKLGEVTAFKDLWQRVAGFLRPDDYTFYAHTKGASKGDLAAPGTSVHTWADLMYKANLDHWPEVQDLLLRHPCVGAFRRRGTFGGIGVWHYSGTFYWMRNKDVFKRQWRKVGQFYGGTEAWPAHLFDYDESGSIFYESNHRFLYDPHESNRAAWAYTRWPWPIRDHTPEPVPMDVTVVIPTMPSRQGQVTKAIQSVLKQSYPVAAISMAVDHNQEGSAVTRNRALDAVKTEWVCFLDDDDEFLVDHVKKLKDKQLATGADVVYSLPVGGVADCGGETFDPERLRKHSYISTTSLVRTSAARAVGGFEFRADDTGVENDDYGLFYKLLEAKYSFAHVHEPTWVYNRDGGNTGGRA